MIIGMIKDAARYEVLSGRIAEALKWLQTVDTAVLQEGKNPIRGEDIFCSVHYRSGCPSMGRASKIYRHSLYYKR